MKDGRNLTPRRLAPSTVIWTVTAVVSVAAVVPPLALGDVDPFVPGRWSAAALVLLVGLFAAVEIFSVHLHFTKNSHSVSLFEIPLTLGLFFAPLWGLMAAHLVGAFIALLFHRRQNAMKLAFNLAAFGLGDGLAIATFRAIASDRGEFDVTSMLAAGAGVMVASMTSAFLVMVALGLSEGRFHARRLADSLAFNAAEAIVSTSLALTAVAIIIAFPEAAWLLLVPTVGLYLTNSAYARERRRHQGIEFLHDSTRLIHQSPELETALVQLVNRAREAFGAGFAELVYLPADGGPALDVIAGDGAVETATGTFEALGVAEIRDHAHAAGTPQLYGRQQGDGPFVAYLERHGLLEVIAAPLSGEDRHFGLLMIGNRRSDVARFDRSDVSLWETLAVNVAAALQNGHLEQSLVRLQQLERRLVHQAHHDALTQLPNRTRLAEAVGDALRAGQAFTLLFVDLDDFKTVNDSLGHAAGDELLTVVAHRLSSSLPEGALAARLGGDEFALVLPGYDDPVAGEAVAHHVLRALELPIAIAGRAVPVRASIGLAMSDSAGDADELLRNADVAMYSAKSLGKHRVAVFEPALHQEAMRRYQVSSELDRAIGAGELVVHYQPIVDLGDRRIAGAEALLRWRHPTRGVLTASEFIGIAEESDRVVVIRRIVLERVCEFLASTAVNEVPAVPLWLNLSTRDLLQPGLAAELASAIDHHGVDPALLVFEVTEGLMIADPEAASRVLGDVKALGARIALDDFGTGYSSLSTLRELPVDVLKIAKPFVDDLGHGEDDDAFVEAIIRMGQVLRLDVVAEGIERADQADRLARLGCRYGQGHAFTEALAPGVLRNALATGVTFTLEGARPLAGQP